MPQARGVITDINYQAEIEAIELSPSKLPLEKYDALIDFVTEKQNLGWMGSIIQAVKLLCVVAFLIGRESLVRSMIKEKKKKIEQLIRLRNAQANEVVD